MLSREELAARFAVALHERGAFAPAKDCVAWAVEAADALLAALASKGVDPESNDVRGRVADAYMMGVDEGLRVGKKVNSTAAPVEAAPGKYVPKVGDVVIGLFPDDELARVDSTDPLRWSAWHAGAWYPGCGFGLTSDTRPATAAERAAVGLPVEAVAPEAKRPEWVPQVGDTFSFPHHPEDTYAVLCARNGMIDAYVGVTGIGKGERYEGPTHWVHANAVTRLPCAAPCPPPVAAERRGTFYLLSGALPPGLTLDTSGEIHGTPTASGHYSFRLGFREYGDATPPVAGSEVGIPRRIDISRQTPIEAAIRAARAAVEAGPAHPHMTRATTLLGQALDAVADFVDGVPYIDGAAS